MTRGGRNLPGVSCGVIASRMNGVALERGSTKR